MFRKSGEATTPYHSPEAGLVIVTVLLGYDPAGVGVHAEVPTTLLYVPSEHAVHPLVFGALVASPV